MCLFPTAGLQAMRALVNLSATISALSERIADHLIVQS